MAFFTGFSLFPDTQRSSSPEPTLNTPTTPPCFTSTTSTDIMPSSSGLCAMLAAIDQTETKPKREATAEIPSTPPASPPSSPPSASKASPGSKQGNRRMTTEAERQVIIGMAFAGKSPSAIANALGLRPNTVSKFLCTRKKAWKKAESSASSALLTPPASPKKKSAGRGKK
ncbi:uncharacterized protein UTRI_00130_B [Ustilago trichophora]|uniref:Uncharacterized protein n=1 Tax=Ustilago trichophora TaxID=86804 RepID=A0A5C3DQP4_9BASI|nr:uncharacterized protein UTRI_00130_B [Ustilago trichophora]